LPLGLWHLTQDGRSLPAKERAVQWTIQGRNEGGKGVTIPRAPNHYGRGKIPKFHKYFLQYSAFASEKTCFEHEGAKLASCPGRHLTSLHPWNYLTFLSRVDAPTTFQIRFETWLGCLQDCSRIIETKWSYGGKRWIEAQSYRSTITIWRLRAASCPSPFPEVEKNTKLFRLWSDGKAYVCSNDNIRGIFKFEQKHRERLQSVGRFA